MQIDKKDLHFATSGMILNRNINTTGFNVDNFYLHQDLDEDSAELFLANSNIDKNNLEEVHTINKYLKYPFNEMTAISGATIYPGFDKITLTKTLKLKMELEECLKRRKSQRKYSGDFIPEKYLSTILNASAGVSHNINTTYFIRQQRTYPSGGGLYPIKIYVLVNKIQGISKGIYLYDPRSSKLIVINNDQKELKYFFEVEDTLDLPNLIDCAFIIFFTMEVWKSKAKYGNAGLRFSLIEIGEISQNAHLVSEAIGVGSCAYASLTQDSINQLLKIDGHFESFQHAILFGIQSRD